MDQRDAPTQPAARHTTSHRIADLERRLDEAREEIGALKLQLDVLATVDMVTGLLTLPGIVEVIDDAVNRRQRFGTPFGVALAHFPALLRLAESAGPVEFEAAARDAGARVAASVRLVDRVGRLDASTFVVVLPQLDRDGVPGLASRLARVPGDEGEVVLSVVLAGTEGDLDPVRLVDHIFDARHRLDVAGPGEPPILIEATGTMDEVRL